MNIRLSFLLALFALGACAPTPPPRAAVGLQPLGRCPASSWQPAAPPPTASAKTSIILLAVQEWARFGKQTLSFSRTTEPRLEWLGVQERDAPERIRDYWAAVDKPELSGLNDIPWSAAFISWAIESAGVPRDLFCPDQRHTIYVERLVDRARRPGAALIPHHPNEYTPRVGDLLCSSREGSGTTLDNLNRGAGHCDIVVEVRPNEVHAIGGNVRDSVSRSIFPLDASGYMTALPGRPLFAVIENRLP